MPKRNKKSADGKYHIGSKIYEILIGSRAQVHHNTAYKTSGGLTSDDLVKNKNGRIVSRKVQATAKIQKRLLKAGYTHKKGVFGAVKIPAGKGKATSIRTPKKVSRKRKPVRLRKGERARTR